MSEVNKTQQREHFNFALIDNCQNFDMVYRFWSEIQKFNGDSRYYVYDRHNTDFSIKDKLNRSRNSLNGDSLENDSLDGNSLHGDRISSFFSSLETFATGSGELTYTDGVLYVLQNTGLYSILGFIAGFYSRQKVENKSSLKLKRIDPDWTTRYSGNSSAEKKQFHVWRLGLSNLGCLAVDTILRSSNFKDISALYRVRYPSIQPLEDYEGVLTCHSASSIDRDGLQQLELGSLLREHQIRFINLPLPEFLFYYENGILMLPGESGLVNTARSITKKSTI